MYKSFKNYIEKLSNDYFIKNLIQYNNHLDISTLFNTYIYTSIKDEKLLKENNFYSIDKIKYKKVEKSSDKLVDSKIPDNINILSDIENNIENNSIENIIVNNISKYLNNKRDDILKLFNDMNLELFYNEKWMIQFVLISIKTFNNEIIYVNIIDLGKIRNLDMGFFNERQKASILIENELFQTIRNINFIYIMLYEYGK